MHYNNLPNPTLNPKSMLIQIKIISLKNNDLLNHVHTPPRTTPFIPNYQTANTVLTMSATITQFEPNIHIIDFD
jgi:NADPH:quinone reductase and related Zn-dependent oxidoreductases